MMLQFIKRHVRVIAVVLGSLSAITVCDFLLLVTCLGLHWWTPFWGAVTTRFMLVVLIGLSLTHSLLYIFRLWVNAKVYSSCGYALKTVQQMIISGEAFLLLILCAAWGLLVLGGQPSVLPLKLLGLVWISGYIAFFVLQIYDLRRHGRPRLS